MHLGLPSILTTDNGSEFWKELNSAMMKQLGIRHNLITPYHPQVHKVYNFSLKFHISLFEKSNGLEERYNQTLQRMLSNAVTGHKEIWDQFIDAAVFAYNILSHESANYTPFEVMFGRKAMIPIDADLESICELLSFCPKLDFVLFHFKYSYFLVQQKNQTQLTTWNMCSNKDKGF